MKLCGDKTRDTRKPSRQGLAVGDKGNQKARDGQGFLQCPEPGRTMWPGAEGVQGPGEHWGGPGTQPAPLPGFF